MVLAAILCGLAVGVHHDHLRLRVGAVVSNLKRHKVQNMVSMEISEQDTTHIADRQSKVCPLLGEFSTSKPSNVKRNDKVHFHYTRT